jgi:hypothetical protein
MIGWIAGMAAVATAGSGPWIQTTGDASIYVSTEAQRFGTFVLEGGNFSHEAGEDPTVDVDDGISDFYLKPFITYGLTPRSEVEASFAFGIAEPNDPNGELCALFGPQGCAPTVGFTPLTVRAKVNWLDQTFGAPLSGSVGLEFRYGQYTAEHRDRLTNLGEGSLDLGLTTALGRAGSLPGGGYFYTYAEGVARYRSPLGEVKDKASPGAEIQGLADLVLVPDGKFGFGPSLAAFSRPGGLDWAETDLADIDRFTVLRVVALQAGAKLSLGVPGRTTATLSLLQTYYAENNPLTTVLSFGLGFNDVFKTAEKSAEESG